MTIFICFVVIIASTFECSLTHPFNLVSSALKMSDYENEVGVIQPTGFWDPLGLSEVSKYLNNGN